MIEIVCCQACNCLFLFFRFFFGFNGKQISCAENEFDFFLFLHFWIFYFVCFFKIVLLNEK